LANMRERLEAVGGTLQIGAAPGSGTSVVAVVPVSSH
jgi:signal transduction histidine kinase